MIRQDPADQSGERADLPEFGWWDPQLLFAPNSTALQSTFSAGASEA